MHKPTILDINYRWNYSNHTNDTICYTSYVLYDVIKSYFNYARFLAPPYLNHRHQLIVDKLLQYQTLNYNLSVTLKFSYL